MAEKKHKGRKFIAMCVGVGYAVFYHILCMIDRTNIELLTFSIIVVTFVGAYIGGNTLSKKFDHK